MIQNWIEAGKESYEPTSCSLSHTAPLSLSKLKIMPAGRVLMSVSLGKQAIVIGAGMSGLAAAAALADRFDRVIVLERDVLPNVASVRPGTPQSAHPHILLFGGMQALCEVFPGFDRDLANAGAVRFGGTSLCEEFPGFDPHFPQRDFGWTGFAMSRPLLELVARRRTQRLSNVELRDQCRVTQIVPAGDGSVAGVKYETGVGAETTLSADLVVDASARGMLTLDFLKDTSQQQPEITSIGIDVNYATTAFEIPQGAPDPWLAVTFPDPKSGTRAGYLNPIEGKRWMVLVSERHAEPPSPDLVHFLGLVRSLRTSTIFDAIKNATPVGKVHRFAFPESSWRHFEQLEKFPTGLLVIGDAICRLNPAYGQGMAVAANEAKALKNLLRNWVGPENKSPLAGLGIAFMKAVSPLIEGAWRHSAVPDLAHPQSRGERPADLQDSLRFGAALMRLAARDPDIHKLMVAVRHLIEPPSALHEPEIVRRIEAEMSHAP
jgi:2-polyprenyl-6-methoxyphenol hydroxylase-like FAD-dependent oxidoreductase